jgi:hypothetical protein
VLCSAHHAAAHHGKLEIAGSVSAGLSFRHADGTPYGTLPSAPRVDTFAKAFAALRASGFRESQVRAALNELTQRPALANADLESVLRAAFAMLSGDRTAPYRDEPSGSLPRSS